MVYHGDTSDHEGREVLTWEGLGEATDDLARQVHESCFDPSVIIAIARGGMVPAGSLTYRLGVKLTDAINVEFYTDVHQTLPDPVLLAPMLDTESITGRRILRTYSRSGGQTAARVRGGGAQRRVVCQTDHCRRAGLLLEAH